MGKSEPTETSCLDDDEDEDEDEEDEEEEEDPKLDE